MTRQATQIHIYFSRSAHYADKWWDHCARIWHNNRHFATHQHLLPKRGNERERQREQEEATHNNKTTWKLCFLNSGMRMNEKHKKYERADSSPSIWSIKSAAFLSNIDSPCTTTVVHPSPNTTADWAERVDSEPYSTSHLWMFGRATSKCSSRLNTEFQSVCFFNFSNSPSCIVLFRVLSHFENNIRRNWDFLLSHFEQ